MNGSNYQTPAPIAKLKYRELLSSEEFGGKSQSILILYKYSLDEYFLLREIISSFFVKIYDQNFCLPF